MSKHRRIIEFVDETAVPYGDDYEFAVQVMTARTEAASRLGAGYETWADLPDGSEFQKEHMSLEMARKFHKTGVEMIINRMDQMKLPEAERTLQMSGLKAIDGIGGFIAEKDGVTYVRKNGTWTPMKPVVQGDANANCPQCQGRGVHYNLFQMEVECDCRMGATIEELDCPNCFSWTDPNCFKCNGTGTVTRRKSVPY
jgi:hypothetical protein